MRLETILCFFLLSIVRVLAHEPIDDPQLEKDIQTYSKQVGISIAEDLRTMSECYDIEAVIQGMREYLKGESTNEAFRKAPDNAFDLIQKKLFEYQARKNLEKAEHFLRKLCQKKTIITLEKDALLYEITESGKGTNSLSADDTFSVRYDIVDTLEKSIFSFDQDDRDGQCTCTLDDFLPSLSRAMLGMVEGEKRTIYIHPDLAYGKIGNLPPNSLLIVKMHLIEILKRTG